MFCLKFLWNNLGVVVEKMSKEMLFGMDGTMWSFRNEARVFHKSQLLSLLPHKMQHPISRTSYHSKYTIKK